ncbi:MAG: hypothetical protein IIA59_01915 [Candidatus Marinimicrobia bacterium]|nr:hypothetical protein [Candidatus Neomarinimicrobiota bacterium]
MSTPPDPQSPFGPQRAGEPPQPREPLDFGDLTPDPGSADQALELFESLLLIAASAPLEGDLSSHPLTVAQAAKAMIGLRPDAPSSAMVGVAMEVCRDIQWSAPDIAALSGKPEQLGLTVSVHDFEAALAAGDAPAAQAQLARLLMVSDSRQYLFDILLDQAARDPRRAPALLPFVHSCQRAYDFSGTLNFADFILPAIAAVAADQQVAPPATAEPVTVWDVLDRLHTGPPELLLLAAHTAQIMADEHIKGPALAGRLGRTLAALAAELPTAPFDKRRVTPASAPAIATATATTKWSSSDLLAAARAGEAERCGAIGRQLAETGERVWLLELLEAAGEITPPLLLWGDAVRMLLRVAPESERGVVGEVAGAQLAGTLSDHEK